MRPFNPGILLFILVSAILLSCKLNHGNCTEYISLQPTQWDLFRYKLKGYKGYTAGTSLIFNSDSTFFMTTCGNIAKGRWRSNEHIIYLDTQEIYNRIDSIRTIQGDMLTHPVFKETIIFHKKGKNLWNEHEGYLTILVPGTSS